MVEPMTNVTLNNDITMPALGLGVFSHATDDRPLGRTCLRLDL